MWQVGREAGLARVVLVSVSVECLLTGEGFIALLTRVGGAGHGSLQSEVQFNAEERKFFFNVYEDIHLLEVMR